MKTLKKIPKFKSEKEEFEFWKDNDSSDYIDFTKGKNIIFPNLKQTTTTISIRIPDALLIRLKNIANKKDIPYQSLIKLYLSEKTEEEIKR